MKRLPLIFLSVLTVAFLLCLLHYGLVAEANWHFAQMALSFSLDISFVLTTVFVIAVVILENGNPVKTVSWILALIFLPIIGMILYLAFGTNYRIHKFFSCHKLRNWQENEDLGRKQLEQSPASPVFRNITPALQKTTRLALANSASIITHNNRAEILNNGEETYGRLIHALKEARKHIHLEYYIIEDGLVFDTIKEILIDKALAGVEVRLIYDFIGSWKLSEKTKRPLRKNGVRVKSFMPLRFPVLTSKINYRNHRKIAVIDGKTGFLGGINISDYYLGKSSDMTWRDTHVEIRGNAVRDLQQIFLQDWYYTSNENLDINDYYSAHEEKNDLPVQIVATGPDSDWSAIQQVYISAIHAATGHIYLVTPYLILSENIKSALVTAALSQVKVHIIIPEKSDSKIVNWVTYSYLEELLNAGIKIFAYSKGFIHSKILTIDDTFVSIGSANTDIRSFEINFEVNAMIYDKKTAVKVREDLENDIADSHEVLMEKFKKRSLMRRLPESVSRLLSPLL